jgi:hypothetical protein
MMRWPVLLLLVPGIAACAVGKGVGAAKGAIYEYGCSKQGDYCSPDGICGTEDAPAPYDLKPTYFAGEPIDDLREYSPGSAIMSNRLIIRLQRSGKQIELNDVLTFDVSNSYEVARCVRGRVLADGTPDWDQANCYRASDNGPGRMRVQFDGYVNASLTLHATCTANLVASAVSRPVPVSYATDPNPPVANGDWTSWVEFEEFGNASQYDVAPVDRGGGQDMDPKFHVFYGERVYATGFFLTLVDETVVTAAIDARPSPHPSIGGTLGGDPTTGRFDFDVQRGQGAQFFP